MKKLTVAGGALLLASLPLISAAQTTSFATPTISTVGGFLGLLTQIFGWIQVAFWILAAIFILLTAFKYLTAQGDESKIATAKQMLVYTIIAIAIGLFATIGISLVRSFLSGGA